MPRKNYDYDTSKKSHKIKNKKENNESTKEKEDKGKELLDVPPDNQSSNRKNIHKMPVKHKSFSNIHLVNNNKEKADVELKKCPLSKKSLNGPKIKDKIYIKFEDLLEFETKLDNIVTSLSNKDNITEGGASNECAEFISFYFKSSLYGIFSNFFNLKNKIIIYSGNNLLLLALIIIYHSSINPKLLTSLVDDMKYILSLLKINFLLIIKKIEIYYNDDFPMKYIDIESKIRPK